MPKKRATKSDIIKPEQVYILAHRNTPTKEIAQFFGVSIDTIERNFRKELDRGRAELKQEIRAAQLNIALNEEIDARTRATMLIFLGKAMLGQSDTQQPEAQRIDAGCKIAIKCVDGRVGIATAGSAEVEEVVDRAS